MFKNINFKEQKDYLDSVREHEENQRKNASAFFSSDVKDHNSSSSTVVVKEGEANNKFAPPTPHIHHDDF